MWRNECIGSRERSGSGRVVKEDWIQQLVAENPKNVLLLI
jgi:hypothetical protein